MQKTGMAALGMLLACGSVACSGSSSSSSSSTGTTGTPTSGSTSSTTVASTSSSGSHGASTGSTGASTTTSNGTSSGSTSTGTHSTSSSSSSSTSTSTSTGSTGTHSTSSSSSSSGTTGTSSSSGSGSTGSTGTGWYCPAYDDSDPHQLTYGGGNTLPHDETWTPGNIYWVLGEMQIGQYALTIQAGTTVCFGDDPTSTSVRVAGHMRLTEGNPAGTVYGKLKIQGTASQPVIFAPQYSDSDFIGLELSNYSEVSIAHLDMYRAGFDSRAIDILDYGSPQPTLQDVTLHDLVKYGVKLSLKAGLSPTSRNLNILSFDLTNPHGDELEAMAVHALALDTLTSANVQLGATIPAAQRIFKLTGSPFITRSVTWRNLGAPIYTNGDVTIEKNTSTDPVPTLTIEAGATVQLSGASLFVGGNGSYDSSGGNLVVTGTAAAPVSFTSGEPTPAAGDWGSVHFTQTGYDPAVSSIAYANFTFGGGSSSQGGIYSCSDTGYAEVEISKPNNQDNPYAEPSITYSHFDSADLGVLAYCQGLGQCGGTDYTSSVYGNVFGTTYPQGVVGTCP